MFYPIQNSAKARVYIDVNTEVTTLKSSEVKLEIPVLFLFPVKKNH